jgi:diacylglycerol kinase (ATP)
MTDARESGEPPSRPHPAPEIATPSTSSDTTEHRWRSGNPLDSFRHAAEGIAHALRTQRNMRAHLILLVLVLLAGLLYRLSPVEMAVLVFTAALVLVTEMVNTAVETVTDMITQEWHPAAKVAKDVAAGAVLVAAVAAVFVGAVLFLGGDRPQTVRLRLGEPPTLHLCIVGGLIVAAVALFVRVIARRNIISLRAAVAFFLAATLIFVANNLFVAMLAILLALLAAFTREEARLHTVREVVIGAMLGLFLTACIYRLPAAFALGKSETGKTAVSAAQATAPKPAPSVSPR